MERRLMPQGKPEYVPADGLTTRQRRNRPLVIVHTGSGKGKSTAAFGLALRAWSQGWPVGVFQFVKSAKWRVGEERALRTLGESGAGGTVTWHKMGEGWSWIQRDGKPRGDTALGGGYPRTPDGPGSPREPRGDTALAGGYPSSGRGAPPQRGAGVPPAPAMARRAGDPGSPRSTGTDHERELALRGVEGWAQVCRDLAAQTYRLYVLDEFTYPITWGWVDVGEVIATLAGRPGEQHVVITGRDAHPRLIEFADLVTEMTKIKHPMDSGQKGQKGIEW